MKSEKTTVFEFQTKTVIITLSIMCCIFLAVALISIVQNRKTSQAVKEDYAQQLELTRNTILQSIYSVSRAIDDNIPTREKRLEIYAKKAKALILQWNPDTDLSDEEMDRMIIENFELSEIYMISPWEFFAYTACESDFTKNAESPADALGIVQFLPSTMKLILVDEYIPGIELNPVWSCRAWYKYFLILSEATGGSRSWTAAAYCTGSLALKAQKSGMDLREYMDWIAKKQLNNPEFPFNVERVFNEFSTYSYANLSK